MTTDALILPFRTIVALVLLMLFLARETRERVIGISCHWLWFAIACNTMVMLIHFIHPTVSLFAFALFAVTGLYLYLVPQCRWSRTYPNIVGLSILLMVVQWRLGCEGVRMEMFHVSAEIWLALVLSVAVVLDLGHTDRLFSINAIFLVTTVSQTLWKWAAPEAAFGPAQRVVFGEYWLCILFVTLVNLSELVLVTRPIRHP